jgi:hypothetical protein
VSIYKINAMKRITTVILLAVLMTACTRSADPVIAPTNFPNTYLGTWRLVAKQAPGLGPVGVWTNAAAGMSIILAENGQITGNTFTDVTQYQIIDSNTVKLIAPSQTAGFYLFDYTIDTVQKALFFYVRPADGVSSCFEGCGTYRFER